MKKIPHILFAIGLMLEILAFLISNASNIPLLLSLLSPTYYNAQQGLMKLNLDKILISKDDGFQEISTIFNKQSIEEGRPDLATIAFVKFIQKTPQMGYSVKSAGVQTPIVGYLDNGQIINWYLEDISADIDTLKSGNIFWEAVIIFSFGVIIQFIGFVIKMHKSSNNRLE